MAGSAKQQNGGADSIAEQRKLVAKALSGGWNREMNWLSVGKQPQDPASQQRDGSADNDRPDRSR